MAEAGPARLGGERRELGERLEDRRLLGRRIDLHVVVDPERLEAEILGPPGDLDGPSPGRRGVHPEVLAIAALRQGQAELHAVAPSMAYVCSTSSRTRPTCSSVAGITSATVNHSPASRTYEPSVRSASPTSSQVIAHRLRPDVDAGTGDRGGHRLRLVVLQHGPREDPQPDRLAVDEVAAGDPLEVVEQEVLHALDVARVPAGVVERRPAPAMGADQGPDPRLRAGPDLVERVDDPAHDRRRVGDQAGVVRPARLGPAKPVGELPVVARGVVAEHVADPGPVQVRGRRSDDVEVDVDGLGDGPAEIADPTLVPEAGAVAERRVDGRRRRDLEERQPPRPGEELRDVEGLAAAETDDRRGPWQALLEGDQLAQLEGLDLVDAGQRRPRQLLLEPGPQVGHRHDEVRPVDERRQLADELVAEDGSKALLREGRGVGHRVMPLAPRGSA